MNIKKRLEKLEKNQHYTKTPVNYRQRIEERLNRMARRMKPDPNAPKVSAEEVKKDLLKRLRG